MYRQRGRMCLMSDDMPELPAPDRMAEAELRLSIQALPPNLRVVIVMHYLEGFSLREMAEMLHVPVGTVKFRLHQARRTLKVELDDGKEASR